MANELPAVSAWLTARLQAQAALSGVPLSDDEPGPQDLTHPAVIWTWLGGADPPILGQRCFITGRYRVEAIAQVENYEALQALADAIDTALAGSTGGGVSQTFNGTIYHARREGPWRKAEAPNGVPYRRLGGIYHITADLA